MSGTPGALPPLLIEDAVERALAEDLGRAGDITSAGTIPADAGAEAVIAARRPGVIAGLALATEAFRKMDGAVAFDALVADGDRVEAGTAIARVAGNARAILSAERTALNFLGHLSGVATLTRRYVDAVAHTRARITCTRKTTPGLRALEKYAVRCGGGSNHRFGLDDAILVKDNHVAVAGGVAEAVRRAKTFAGHLAKIEVEVDTLDQLREALAAGAEAILLDNMEPAKLLEAVAIAASRAALEASGGVTLENVAAIAETGVDYISSGAITHSAPALDLGLDVTVRS
ncbi:MAG: carboxylating nicotinate-nucleotide diphosphorylase [Propylenella sp.]